MDLWLTLVCSRARNEVPTSRDGRGSLKPWRCWSVYKTRVFLALWVLRTQTSSVTMIKSQVLLFLSLGLTAVTGRSAKPNFIFIITDDQDLHLNSIDYQPSVQKHFAQEGTWFKKHFCTVALCCPSRVSLLTGKAAHNTNVTDVSAPYGKLDISVPLYEQTLTTKRGIS